MAPEQHLRVFDLKDASRFLANTPFILLFVFNADQLIQADKVNRLLALIVTVKRP